ncbi:MAG: YciI family protein [Myxococcota bacterium]
MQYLILIYSTENQAPKPQTAEEREAMMKPWNEYTQAMVDAGVHVAGEALQNTGTATTVRFDAGKGEPIFTDGPFAETKEQLGGFYLIECQDLDEAMVWGSKCPAVHFGSVEIRPVMAFD